MGEATGDIRSLIAAEVETAVAAPFRSLADAVRRRHDPAGLGVLFYGSCLRSGEDRDQVADLYLIVERYGAAYGNPLQLSWLGDAATADAEAPKPKTTRATMPVTIDFFIFLSFITTFIFEERALAQANSLA